ncbi:tRNA (guanosine(46)-N7)-methyltransferase TrmB [Tuberibacillus sp. Marseille-P3662]|uniref:tRNA (guanosine(46)-N7)-methyltransferase TrmB n=1 Tax=Tuberibacillus sp. Marseille-P3662 TaxID=1965358 RepID=UPI000A1C8A9F|nr:tRNA (guanosine(46)-N7)-methyltransferase TrmB [Tuberibacillus sp. Marseille-P3662]
MRPRYKPWAKDFIARHPEVIIPNAHEKRGMWHTSFAQPDLPLHIEIGSGKGKFIFEMAQRHPDVNFIGIERDENIIVSILQKIIQQPLDNLRLLQVDANDLLSIFAPNEVDRFYLNFSDPWPKNRHEKRRLTYRAFLDQYKTILKPSGELHMKTDNQGLFEYSLESFSRYGMIIKNISLDLHQSNFPDNVTTEYEEKFKAKGQRIYHCQTLFR